MREFIMSHINDIQSGMPQQMPLMPRMVDPRTPLYNPPNVPPQYDPNDYGVSGHDLPVDDDCVSLVNQVAVEA
jgi:hypothetical protein